MKRLLNLDLLEFHVREATQEADAQFDRNEKFPRPRDSVGWFAKFWPKTLIRKSKRKSGVAEAQMA